MTETLMLTEENELMELLSQSGADSLDLLSSDLPIIGRLFASVNPAVLTDTLIIVEAGDLKKNAALRANAERGRHAMALPCYQDEGRALDQMIDEDAMAIGVAMHAALAHRVLSEKRT